MVIGIELLEKFAPPQEDADQASAELMIDRVRTNLNILEDAVKEGSGVDAVRVLDNIHKQLIDCPEIPYLLAPEEIKLLIDQYIGKGREQIVTEKTATATLKKEEKERKKRLAAHDKVDLEKISVEDY